LWGIDTSFHEFNVPPPNERGPASPGHLPACFPTLPQEEATAPFMEPFVRSFILGAGAGALLEGGHIALQVLAGRFPGLGDYSPLLFADHVTALASWICLYAVEAVAILTVLKRFNWDSVAAAKDIKGEQSMVCRCCRRHEPCAIHLARPLRGVTRLVMVALSACFWREGVG